MSSYQDRDPEGVRKARDSAYNDALQKLGLKLRAVVRGRVRTSLSLESAGMREATEQAVESVTTSVVDLALGRKRFEEYRDERRREYWVRCLMSREEADAALQAALAEAARRRSERGVSLRLSGADSRLVRLAEAEFARLFSERGFRILSESQAPSARIVVSGEVRAEGLGASRPLGVDVGLACRAALAPEATVSRGGPEERRISGAAVRGVTGFGRSQPEACEQAAQSAAAQAAASLIEALTRAIED
jgi:hypothetical protein